MSIENPDWLHAAICSAASQCKGVDFLAHDVEELNARGFDIVAADVLSDEPSGRFDVVVAGDLIEHLDNPGTFLQYVAGALNDRGIAVITTPNAFYLAQLWQNADQTSVQSTRFSWTLSHSAGSSSAARFRIRELYWLEPSWTAFWNTRNPLVDFLVRRPLDGLTRLILAVWPFLNSDFAADPERFLANER